MNFRLDCRNGILCVRVDKQVDIVTAAGPVGVRKWFPVREVAQGDVAGLLSQTLTPVDEAAGLYVDESGESYTLQNGAETEAIEVEIVRTYTATASNGTCASERIAGQNGQLLLTYRGDGATPMENGQPADHRATISEILTNQVEEEAVRELSAAAVSVRPVARQLSLKQKLAEVRRRIGQIEKRGINHEGNYRYVRAADLAGAVGDVLAELGVILLPQLESISTEPLGPRSGADHLTRVVIAYRFIDSDSTEELTVKMAGEGLDFGDKGVCKAQTSALKYALLQSFMIATGDDPEAESGATEREHNPLQNHSDRGVSAAQVQEVRELISETGTELDRVLEYFEIGSLEEMVQTSYRKAMSFLRRKLAKTNSQAVQAA
jgi:hypothetical protein